LIDLILAGFPTTNDIIFASDNLEEKLDTSIEGLRSKE
jgi:hypothetical protein